MIPPSTAQYSINPPFREWRVSLRGTDLRTAVPGQYRRYRGVADNGGALRPVGRTVKNDPLRTNAGGKFLIAASPCLDPR
jgi:hypothetical protein